MGKFLRNTGVVITSLLSVSVSAQQTREGSVARSTVGRAGQRQTASEEGLAPLTRVDGRIQSRIQSRIRNRIDRFYDPRANTEAPFTIASDRAREAAQRRTR